jgi:hypothetical protein
MERCQYLAVKMAANAEAFYPYPHFVSGTKLGALSHARSPGIVTLLNVSIRNHCLIMNKITDYKTVRQNYLSKF